MAGKQKHLTANAVVTASGLFSTPKRLDAPGIEEFARQIIHIAECTGQEDLDGKRVAIVGNGSTGVQMAASVQKRAARLDMYQRTPQWISPRERYGAPIAPETRWLLDTMPYYWNWCCYSIATLRLDAQLLQEPDLEWKAGGGFVNAANDGYRRDLTAYIKAKLPAGPDLWKKLIPSHAPLARRMIVDNNWYSSLREDNVEQSCGRCPARTRRPRVRPGPRRAAPGRSASRRCRSAHPRRAQEAGCCGRGKRVTSADQADSVRTVSATTCRGPVGGGACGGGRGRRRLPRRRRGSPGAPVALPRRRGDGVGVRFGCAVTRAR